MPFCPICKTEYVAGVARCADCGVPLFDELPVEQSVEYDECAHCSEQVTKESDFCIHCGVLLSDEKFHCKNHPATPAVAVCTLCRCLLCVDCKTERQGRMLCDEHKAVEISEDWAVAFQSVDYYEANIIRGKLESSGITVNPRNNTSIGFIADGFIESAIGRSILRYPVKIFVPLDQYIGALEILKEELPLTE
jgi:hypothetical protein